MNFYFNWIAKLNAVQRLFSFVEWSLFSSESGRKRIEEMQSEAVDESEGK